MYQNLVSPESAVLSPLGVSMRQEESSLPSASPLAPTVEERRTMLARIKRLRRHSLLTPAALAQMGRTELPTETIHALLTMLEGPFEERAEERTAAAWALGLAHLTPRQRQTVSYTLCHVLRRKPLARRVQQSQAVDPLFAWLSAYALLCFGVHRVLQPVFYNASTASIGAGICAFMGSMVVARFLAHLVKTSAFIRDTRMRATTATALGRLGCVSSIPTLARVALDAGAATRSAAELALQVCLSNLTLGQSGQLEADVVPNLCRLLEKAREQLSQNTPRAESLALSVLTAFAKIEDGRAADGVRNLINTGWTAPVQRAAKELLPLLLAKRQQAADQRVLLRGAAMPPAAPATLLRPTGLYNEEDAPHTLLRSSQSLP